MTDPKEGEAQLLNIRLNGPLDETREALNLDYRFLSLMLFHATYPKLLENYLSRKWKTLLDLGLPPRLLEDALYLFNDPATQRALRQLQLVTQTLIKLSDYCDDACPNLDVLAEIAQLNSQQAHPSQAAGVED
jgi:hypothetical protein